MKLTLHRHEYFNADFDHQYRWYLEHAGEDVAERFLRAVVATLKVLTIQPDLGRSRRFKHPELRGLHSFGVEAPFNKVLIFYRRTNEALEAWRLMHGARDLPRRLAERPA